MALSHRAEFKLIINFFRLKAISTGLLFSILLKPSTGSGLHFTKKKIRICAGKSDLFTNFNRYDKIKA